MSQEGQGADSIAESKEIERRTDGDNDVGKDTNKRSLVQP